MLAYLDEPIVEDSLGGAEGLVGLLGGGEGDEGAGGISLELNLHSRDVGGCSDRSSLSYTRYCRYCTSG